MWRHRLRLLCAAATLAIGVLAAPALWAGILIEATLEGTPLRAEVGRNPERVLITAAGRQRLIDLTSGQIWLVGERSIQPDVASATEDGSSGAAWRLEAWGRGPSVAGYGSTYNVLQRGETICAEVLASRWMAEFVEPVVRAIALLQRVEPALQPKARPGCGAVPFAVYARNGWPLMAGYRDAPIFRTHGIRFDHRVDPARFRIDGEAQSANAGS
jgi:hypothetical protein